MAITVVQKAQTAGGGNNTSLTITAATAGNTLVSFFSQTGVNTPTCTGFTVDPTKAVYNASGSSIWVATKIAAGGETSIAWTPGSGGTGHGVVGFELAGAAASVTLDGSVVHTDNIASAATAGQAVTTGVAGSIVLLGVGADSSTGTINAWTGTNVATNVGTAAARPFGGSFITTTTVSSTFTANWTTAHVSGMLGLALQPAGGATKDIAGSSAGAATVSGGVNQTNADVSGSSAGVATAAGSVAQTFAAVTGSSAGAATASGGVPRTASVAGASSGAASCSGSVNRTASVAGSATGTATATGTLDPLIPSAAAPFHDQTPELLVSAIRHP